jgi:hypothetical protein
LWLKANPGPIYKKNIKKRAGGVAQVIEWLSSKCETLSSNPTTAKKKKKATKNAV